MRPVSTYWKTAKCLNVRYIKTYLATLEPDKVSEIPKTTSELESFFLEMILHFFLFLLNFSNVIQTWSCFHTSSPDNNKNIYINCMSEPGPLGA